MININDIKIGDLIKYKIIDNINGSYGRVTEIMKVIDSVRKERNNKILFEVVAMDNKWSSIIVSDQVTEHYYKK